jgi:hypothetical protein
MMVIDFASQRYLRRPGQPLGMGYSQLTLRNQWLQYLRHQVERECLIYGYGLDPNALNNEVLRRFALLARAA